MCQLSLESANNHCLFGGLEEEWKAMNQRQKERREERKNFKTSQRLMDANLAVPLRPIFFGMYLMNVFWPFRKNRGNV